jgi:hypothetical protein
MRMRDKFMTAIVLGATALMGVDYYRISNNAQSSSLEYVLENNVRFEGNFSGKEEAIIKDMISKVTCDYAPCYDLVFIKPSEKFDKEIAGRAFAKLGSESNSAKDFIERFGKENYERLKGKDVIVLRDFEFYENYAGKDNELWSSIYLPNPSAKVLYKRTILHEIGHAYFHNVENSDLVDRLFKIDIESEAYKNGKNHPAHPSYRTYFWCGAPEAEGNEEYELANANEVFADIFALSLLGCIDNDVKDRGLAEKIRIVNNSLRAYRKANF